MCQEVCSKAHLAHREADAGLEGRARQRQKSALDARRLSASAHSQHVHALMHLFRPLLLQLPKTSPTGPVRKKSRQTRTRGGLSSPTHT